MKQRDPLTGHPTIHPTGVAPPLVLAIMGDQSMQLTTAEKIVIYRHRNHLSQATLADLVHMSTSTLARIESGARQITLDELSSFAAVFHVPLSDFLPDSPDS